MEKAEKTGNSPAKTGGSNSGTNMTSKKSKKKKPVYPPYSGARSGLRLPPSRTDPEGWYSFVPPQYGAEPEGEDDYP